MRELYQTVRAVTVASSYTMHLTLFMAIAMAFILNLTGFIISAVVWLIIPKLTVKYIFWYGDSYRKKHGGNKLDIDKYIVDAVANR